MPTAFLTFDDGPQPGTTDVLDALKEGGATATFFLTGENSSSVGDAAAQKAVLRRILDEGHVLGNHCHRHLPQTKDQYVAAYGNLDNPTQKNAFKANLASNAQHFGGLMGQPTFAFAHARLPGDGRTFPRYVQEVQALGMKHHTWVFEFAPNGEFSWVPHNDWQSIKGVAASHVQNALPPDNGVILMHDRHWRGSAKRTLLGQIIGKLKEKSYSLKVLA